MSLNDLTDQELNALCCKALGWKWQLFADYLQVAGRADGWWSTGEGIGYEFPNFCADLDLIQQYLVPVLRSQPASVQQRYYQHAQRVYWQSGETDGMLDQFMLMSIPARVRVLAFLQAMGVER
ncbi:hypothetical protein [Deinococcus misasensis]|uniref:hypothetical protein n=1 Tax=Deinococcus misasensis TaxID=392413 RepID=UPI0005564760|nr:hypothetical protein [Deinococcus misasensis]